MNTAFPFRWPLVNTSLTLAWGNYIHELELSQRLEGGGDCIGLVGGLDKERWLQPSLDSRFRGNDGMAAPTKLIQAQAGEETGSDFMYRTSSAAVG